MIYLDNAATTKVTKPVLDAMLPYLTEDYGNPSSVHSMGKKAKQAVEHAREQVATAIGAKPEQIFFTSGATESNNWVGETILMKSEFEHPSMDSATPIQTIVENYGQPIDGYGTEEQFQEDYEFWWRCKKSKYQQNISHIWVNNNTGEIYDIDQWIKRIHRYHRYFHTDATQAFGHIPIDVDEQNIDFLTLSGHKFHAPKGVGVLYVRKPDGMCDCNFGGGQERGYRSGTENVASIVAMGKAAELYNYNEDEHEQQQNKKDYIMNYIRNYIPNYQFVLPLETAQVPNIIAVAFKNVYGGDLVELMSLKGVCVSSGSACSSNSKHSVSYPTLPTDLQDNVIRISMSVETTSDEVAQAMQILRQCVQQIRGE